MIVAFQLFSGSVYNHMLQVLHWLQYICVKGYVHNPLLKALVTCACTCRLSPQKSYIHLQSTLVLTTITSLHLLQSHIVIHAKDFGSIIRNTDINYHSDILVYAWT